MAQSVAHSSNLREKRCGFLPKSAKCIDFCRLHDILLFVVQRFLLYGRLLLRI